MVAASATERDHGYQAILVIDYRKQPIDPVPDADLDDFVVAKPGPSKKAQFAKPLSEMQMTDLEKGPVVPNTACKVSCSSRSLHGVSNCTINFAPKTINIGVEIGLGGVANTEEMDEFDSIVSDMPLDF